ncbi:MAG: alpha/beta hydrolase [Armatimonadota bacterium]
MSEGARTFIHRFVPAQRAGAPTLLLLHGTGGNEDDLIPLGERLAPGAALLSPRGNVLEQGMPRFFRRLTVGVFDVEDLRFRAQELADFVEAAGNKFGFSTRDTVAVGYSNGANIAAAVLLLRPEVLGRAILFRPMLPFAPDQPPDLSATPVFIGASRTDPYVSPEQTQQLIDTLQGAGALVTLRWASTGHALEPQEVDAASQWLLPLISAR